MHIIEYSGLEMAYKVLHSTLNFDMFLTVLLGVPWVADFKLVHGAVFGRIGQHDGLAPNAVAGVVELHDEASMGDPQDFDVLGLFGQEAVLGDQHL